MIFQRSENVASITINFITHGLSKETNLNSFIFPIYIYIYIYIRHVNYPYTV
jgi:hypothetical protein